MRAGEASAIAGEAGPRVAIGAGAEAVHAFERSAERERGAVAHLARHRANGGSWLEQEVRGEGQPPARQERHRRFADQLMEASSQRSARDSRAGGQAGDRPRMRGVVVHHVQRPTDDRVAGGAVPSGYVCARSCERRSEGGNQQQVEQPVEHDLLARFVLDDLVGQQRDDRAVPRLRAEDGQLGGRASSSRRLISPSVW